MTDDPIVAEIRKVRHEHAEKFNNDIAAICEDYRRMEKESGRTYVSFPPRLVKPKTDQDATGNDVLKGEFPFTVITEGE